MTAIGSRMTSWRNKKYSDDILHFTAEEDGSSVSLNYFGDWVENYNYLEISTDGKTWTEYDGAIIHLANTGDKVYFNTPEGVTNHAWGNDYEFKFVMEGKIAASGNIMSLVVKDGLTDSIPEEEWYYFYGMFEDCTSLITAPQLNASYLADYCYNNMFFGCTSLTTAPQINAKYLANRCCYSMFQDCTSLKIREGGTEGTKILDIPTGTSQPSNWNINMFYRTGGTFTGNPQVGVAYYCYQ